MCAMLLIHTPSHPAPPYSTSPHLATPSTSSHRLLRDRPHLAIINQGLLVTRGERMQDRQNGWVHRLTRKSMQQFRHHTHTHTRGCKCCQGAYAAKPHTHTQTRKDTSIAVLHTKPRRPRQSKPGLHTLALDVHAQSPVPAPQIFMLCLGNKSDTTCREN